MRAEPVGKPTASPTPTPNPIAASKIPSAPSTLAPLVGAGPPATALNVGSWPSEPDITFHPIQRNYPAVGPRVHAPLISTGLTRRKQEKESRRSKPRTSACCLKGRLRGKQPKLTPQQEAVLVDLHAASEHTSSELAQLFGVARSTVYRALERQRAHAAEPAPVPAPAHAAVRRCAAAAGG